MEFMGLIHYDADIDLARLNKNYVIREWRFMFDSMLKVFTGRKTCWDHISHPAQHLLYSLIYNKSINVGRLIIKELVGRLGKSPAKRGNEIFFPRFIQSVLNFKNSKLTELEGMNAQRIGYSKSMSKIVFGTLDAKNIVDVPLQITPHMTEIFEAYTLVEPIYFSLSMEKTHQAEAIQNQLNQNESNPSIAPSSKPLDVSEPSASGSQKSKVTKKKMKNKEPLFTINESLDENVQGEDTESTLASLQPRKKKIKTKTSSLSSLS